MTRLCASNTQPLQQEKRLTEKNGTDPEMMCMSSCSQPLFKNPVSAMHLQSKYEPVWVLNLTEAGLLVIPE